MRISDCSSDVCSSDLVEEQAALAAELVAELAERLQEGQPLDVADRAAELADDAVLVGEVRMHEGLDGIGDVRDDLHGGAEVVAAPLPREHLRVPLTRAHAFALPLPHARAPPAA